MISETLACVLVVLCMGGAFCFGWLAGHQVALREWRRGYNDACEIWKVGYYELLANEVLKARGVTRGGL